jgi:hypothetical protein
MISDASCYARRLPCEGRRLATSETSQEPNQQRTPGRVIVQRTSFLTRHILRHVLTGGEGETF